MTVIKEMHRVIAFQNDGVRKKEVQKFLARLRQGRKNDVEKREGNQTSSNATTKNALADQGFSDSLRLAKK
jgi:hypothetical protein